MPPIRGQQRSWRDWIPAVLRRSPPSHRCHAHDDCGNAGRFCCDQTTHRCMRRDDPLARRKCQLPAADAGAALPVYPDAWKLKPGAAGFNAYLRGVLDRGKIQRGMTCAQGEDRWYQNVLAFLMHRRTPIRRLLVVWQLGTGKTIGMLRVLDQYFTDPRPKVLLFPTDAVVANFYEELAKHPNAFMRAAKEARDLPPTPGPDDSVAVRTRFVEALRDFLSLWPVKKFNNRYNGLPAPMRAFTYAEIGHSEDVNNAIFNWQPDGYDRHQSAQRMCNMVVLCDEAHNLVSPPSGASADAVRACATMLTQARDSVAVFFTATPLVNGRDPDRQTERMLALVKGVEYAGRNHEGFVSWFMDRPVALFAQVLPPRVTLRQMAEFRDEPEVKQFPKAYDRLLPNVIPVRMDTFDNEPIWREYVACRWGRGTQHAWPKPKPKKPKPKPKPKTKAKANAPEKKCDEVTAAALEHISQTDGPLTMVQALGLAPKLAAIARSTKAVPLKTLILIHADNGPATLVRLIQSLGVTVLDLGRPGGGTAKEAEATRQRNKRNLATFNAESNTDGDEVRVVVATAEEWSEGATFMAVRRVVLADLSPGVERPGWSTVKQRVGRALRSCSHELLDAKLRTLTVDLYVTVHDEDGYEMTHDARKLLDLIEEIPRVEAAMDQLARLSFDASFYRR